MDHSDPATTPLGDPPGTRPPWYDQGTRERLLRPALTRDSEADVCVVGAGMAGMCCAYALARAGRRVIVLDDGPIGGGETGRTTAHLTNAVDDRYYRIEESLGRDAARICAESHTAAIGFFHKAVADDQIDCGLVSLDGYLFLPPGESDDILARELAAAHRAGLGRVERVAHAPSFESGPCLRYPDQAQFHPLRFLDGLAQVIERLGGQICGATRVIKVDRGHPVEVRTASGLVVRAAAVIVATNSPINDRVSMHSKQAAYRTYALAARIPAGSVAIALYWDTSERPGDEDGPYHYVRVMPAAPPGGPPDGSDDLLIVGGGDHLTGDPEDAPARWGAIETWARERWPVMKEVVHRWSGQVIEPHDRVAFIGRNPGLSDNIFIVTGDSGMGMTHSAIAAIMMPDLISGREHPWSRLYDPSRKPLHSLGEFARHAGRMAGHYADWLTPGADLDEIRPGEGNVVRRGLHLIAAYRDERGIVHARGAKCTHLGCVVRWNNAEKSWDCPCHGSRYDATGRVLNGPARHDLPRQSLSQEDLPRESA